MRLVRRRRQNTLAATLVGVHATHLVIVDCDLIGTETPLFDPNFRDVSHEQLGALPLEFIRRITVAQRRITHRCARRTKSGQACPIPVSQPGGACAWHRAKSE